MVRFHDPAGFPFATLPVEQFTAAWRTDSLVYGESVHVAPRFRSGPGEVTAIEAIRASASTWVSWLRG